MFRLRRAQWIPIFTVAIFLLFSACDNPEQKLQKHLVTAKQRIEARDFQAARIELLNAIKADPSSSQAYYLLGRTLLGIKDFRGAARAFANANELDPKDRDIALEYCQLLTTGKAYDIAEPIILSWLSSSPEDPDFLILLSIIQAKTGEGGQAIETAGKVVQLQPSSLKAWLHLTQIYLLVGNRKEAQSALARAEELAPASVEAGVMRVSLLEKEGLLDEAIARLEQLDVQNPGNVGLKMNLARLYERAGKEGQAIRVYRDLSEKEHHAPALNLLGRILYGSGQKEEAVQLWEKSVQTDPYFLEPRLSLIRDYWSRGDLEKATAVAEEALRYAPGNSELLALRGELSMASGLAREAIPYFQQALESEPANLAFNMSLAQAQLAAGDQTQARERLKYVVGKDVHYGPANLLLAKIEASAGNIEMSSQYAMAASVDKDQGREAMWVLGDNSIRRGVLPEAKSIYARCIQRHGDHPGSRLRLAHSQELLGELEKAENGYRALLKERPGDILPLTYLISLLGRTDRKEEAIVVARNAASGGDAPHLLLLGRVLEGVGDLEEAREAYLSVTRSNPELLEPYRRIAATYARESRLGDARTWLTESIEDSDSPQVSLLFLLGVVQDLLGERKSAMDSYREVLDQDPGFVPALNNLAWNLSEAGDLRPALEFAAKARKFGQEDPFVADTYGWILHRAGDSAGALPVLRQAMEALPEDKTVRSHLVEVLKAVGREEEAARQQKMLDGPR